MNKIVEKEHFSEKVIRLVVEAPLIARARKPGHFVIVISDEKGERIPLTIADSDEKAGTITLIVQAVGESTISICAKEPGEFLHDVVGPPGYVYREFWNCSLLWRRRWRRSAAPYSKSHESGRK